MKTSQSAMWKWCAGLSLALGLSMAAPQAQAAYSGVGIFTKITSRTDLTVPGYYVVAYNTNMAMNCTNTAGVFSNTVLNCGTSITNPPATIVWYIATNSTYGGLSLYSETTARYVAGKSGANNAYAAAAINGTTGVWSFVWNSTVFNVALVFDLTRYLQYNTSSPRFANYTGSQQHLTLYKMGEAATPAIALADNGTQVAAGNVAAGATKVVLHQSSLAVTVANATLTGVSFTSAGTYAAADITKFQVWYSADNSLATTGDNVQLGSDITSSLGAGAHSVSSLSQAINSGSTGYVFITADVAAAPTGGNTINVAALTTSDFTFSSGDKTGSTTAGGEQTLQAAVTSSSSDIVSAGSEPSNVDYASHQETDLTSASLQVGSFTIRDGGASSPDSDSAATTLNAITFTVANGANLRRVALYDGDTEIAEVAGGTSAAFSGLSGLVAADDGTKTFKILASFASSVTDNQQLSFTVSSATADTGGSTFAAGNAGGAVSSTSGDANRIEVTATKLVFSVAPPAKVAVGANFSATVQAQDANNNLDLDSTTSVTISQASGSGTLTGGTAQALVAGAKAFTALQMDTAGDFTIQAADGVLTAATSGTINAAVVYSGAGTFALITSAADVTDGYYVLVNSGDTVAMNRTNTVGTYFTNEAVTVSGGTIVNPNTSIVWLLQTNATYGGHTIYNEAAAKFASFSGAANAAFAADAVTGTTGVWTFAYASSVFTVANKADATRYLAYNSASPRFACYTTGQQKLHLYKLVTATVPTVTSSAATGIGATTATLNGNVTADGYATITDRGFCFKAGSGVAITDNKSTVAGTTGAYTFGPTLDVNTRYYFIAYASNSVGLTLSTPELDFWTLANVPAAPTVANPATTALDVSVNENGNPAATEFAIQCTNNSLYVQADGTLGASAAWATKTTWGTKTVTGLSPSATYGFQAKARNGADVETAFGAVANGTTLEATGIWINPMSAGTPMASYYLGDVVGEWFVNFEIGQTWWNYAQVGIGTGLAGTDYNWGEAPWYQDGDGDNKRVRRNLSGFQFTAAANYYVICQAKAYAGDAYTSKSGNGWGNSQAYPPADIASAYFSVSAINDASAPAADANGADPTHALDLSWAKNAQGHEVMIVRKAAAASWTEPVQGTPYALSDSLGAGTVVYVGSGTATTDSGLSANSTYDYKFYSVNNDYYAAGVTAQGTTLPCEPDAPAGVYASATNADSFTASWTAADRATGYRLDVSESATFLSGGGADLINEGFETWTNGWSNPAPGWTQNSATFNGSLPANAHSGSNSIGMNAAADWIQTPAVENPGTLSFWCRTSSDPGDWTVVVRTSPNGTDWTDRATIVENGTGGTINNTHYQTNVVLDLTGTYYIRFAMTARTADSIYIDDVVLTPLGAPSFVSGYENLAVAGTSQLVAGLAPNKTYYFRVRAEGEGGCPSADSATASVTTLKGTPSVTAWPTASAIVFGQTLAASTLSGGEASVAGTFGWTDDSIAPPVGTADQGVTFTPTSADYNAVEGVASVKVKSLATVELLDLEAVYDGTPKAATVVTDPDGLVVDVTYDGNSAAPTAVGEYAVVATVVDDDYAGSASDTLVIAKADQTIDFAAIGDQMITDTVNLSATASSGLTVAFEVLSGPATISGGTTLTFTGVGEVSIRASQTGNGNWNAAPAVTRTFNVSQETAQVLSQSSVNVRENGQGRFFVRLNQAPSTNVVVSVARSAGDGSIAIQKGASLTFKPSNWDTWQAVTLAQDDDANDVGESATFQVSMAGVADQFVAVATLDDDVGANLALASSGTSVSARYASFPEQLIDGVHGVSTNYGWTSWTNDPRGTITLDLKVTGTVSHVRLLNWDWAWRVQRYQIESSTDGENWTMLADASAEDHRGWDEWIVAGGRVARYLKFTGISNSLNQCAVVSELEVYGERDLSSLPQPVVSKASVNVREGGEGRFLVRLDKAPEGSLTVNVARNSGSDSIAIQGEETWSFTFTAANWNEWQKLTLVQAADDENTAGETAVFRVSAIGRADQFVTATALDDDGIGENLARAEQATISGMQSSGWASLVDGVHDLRTSYGWTIWTNETPPSTITLDLKTVATVSRVRLLSWDWSYRVNRYKIESSTDKVNWTMLADASGEDHSGWDNWTFAGQPMRYLRFTGLWDSYNQFVVLSELEVYGTRDPLPAPELLSTAVNVREAGEGRFFLRLAEAPTGTVTFTVSRSSGDASLALQGGATRAFKTSNWSTWQAVTLVQAADDGNAVGETATFRISAPGYADTFVTATALDDEVGENLARTGGSTITGVRASGWATLIDGVHNSSASYGWTLWSNASPGTVTLDLKAVATVSAVRLLSWDWSYRVNRYMIESSTDGVSWSLLVDASGENHNGWDNWTFAGQAVRYLRFTGLWDSYNQFTVLSELEVYGTRPAGKRALAAASATDSEPVAVLTSEGPQDETGWNAVDGDDATAWVGQKAGGGYLVVEYRPTLTLSGLEVDVADGALAEAQVLTSLDGQAWQPLPEDLVANPVALNFLWVTFPADGSDAMPNVIEIRPNP